MKKLLWGAVFGGLVVFAWGALSWMVLPWHANTLHAFTQEAAVVSALKEAAPVSGVYLLPSWRPTARTVESRRVLAKRGPLLLAVVNLEGADPSNPMYYLRGLLIQVLGAGCLTALLLSLRGLTYWGRVRTAMWVGLTAGVLCRLSDWGWWSFSTPFMLVSIMDLGVSWFFGGLAIAAVLQERRE